MGRRIIGPIILKKKTTNEWKKEQEEKKYYDLKNKDVPLLPHTPHRIPYCSIFEEETVLYVAHRLNPQD